MLTEFIRTFCEREMWTAARWKCSGGLKGLYGNTSSILLSLEQTLLRMIMTDKAEDDGDNNTPQETYRGKLKKEFRSQKERKQEKHGLTW